MAVYTDLGTERLADLIAAYDVGDLVSAKGIAEGVSNSNWLIETSGKDGSPGSQSARFILTMYERRIDIAELPFFLDLLDHLAANGCPVPRTIHDRSGASSRMLQGKAVALIEFLPGVSVGHPTPPQARSVGRVLAEMHATAQNFAGSRANDLGPQNIRVNAISAGPLDTLSSRVITGYRDMKRIHAERSPMGRNITTDEVAKTALYLCSDMSSGVTGEILHVDTGYNIMGL